MCRGGIYALSVRLGRLAVSELNNVVNLNLMSPTDKIRAIAILLNELVIQQSDLDDYVTNNWITLEEKQLIISEAATMR